MPDNECSANVFLMRFLSDLLSRNLRIKPSSRIFDAMKEFGDIPIKKLSLKEFRTSFFFLIISPFNSD